MRRVWMIGAICLALGGCAKLEATSGSVFGSTGRAEAEQQMSYHFNEGAQQVPVAEAAPARQKVKQARKRAKAVAPTPAPAEEETPSE